MRTEKRILVVDDDDAIRTLVARVLHRRGMLVDLARNGEEALESIAACRYSLIILDLMMPRMSGYQFLEHLTALPSASHKPMVLVLTAGLDPKPFNTRLVVGTIHKPFDIDLLVDAVYACITIGVEQPQADSCPSAEQLSRPEEAN